MRVVEFGALGLRVVGFQGFREEGLGLSLGCSVESLVGFRAESLELRVSSLELTFYGIRSRVRSLGFL